jgi:hypothetical protein
MPDQFALWILSLKWCCSSHPQNRVLTMLHAGARPLGVGYLTPFVDLRGDLLGERKDHGAVRERNGRDLSTVFLVMAIVLAQSRAAQS